VRRRVVVALAIAVSWTTIACGADAGDSPNVVAGAADARSDSEFCESMEHLIVLLAPSGPMSPQDTEAAFSEASGWFEQARRSAPASIADDVAAYASAYDAYLDFLAESGFNLDVVFSTTEGRDLAIETSHTLTVPIVEYTTNECGLSFGDEV
jgi:hypothetical protein